MKVIYVLLLINCYTVKLFSQSIVWENTIGGNNTEWNSFIQKTSDGNAIIGGYSYSNISGDKTENSRGQGDYWLVKVNTDTGNLIWQKTIGGINFDHLTSGFETNDGGYILGGYSSSGISGEKTENSRGGDDYWIIKLDSNRNIVWQKTFGGSSVDRLTSIIATDDGGYLIAGDSNSVISGDKTSTHYGFTDIWVIKINSIGNIEWQKSYGGWDNDFDAKLIKTSNNSYLLGCSSHSSLSGNNTTTNNGIGDFWILNLDLNGNIIWQKSLGGSNGDYLQSILETNDGNYLIQGSSASNISGDKSENSNGWDDIWILKISYIDGSIIWQKTIGGNSTDLPSGIKKTSDGNYIMLAMSYSDISGQKTEANKGDRDYWLIKIDSNGNVIWDKTIGGSLTDQPQDLIEISPNQYISSGWSKSDASGDKSENSNGPQDNWVVKFKNCTSNINSNASLTVCNNQNINLSAPNGNTYNWVGPNNFISSEQNPIITNASSINSGQYLCTITENSSGCINSITVDVFVGDIENPIVEILNLPNIVGDCNTIISTIPTALDNCSGTIIATTTNPLSYSEPGNYLITWNYTDGNGNSTFQTQSVIITSTTTPITNQNFYLCLGQTQTLNNITVSGQNIKWYDATTGGNLLPNTTPLQNGITYYASQTINGCESARVPVLVNIQNTPAPTGNQNQSFCSTENATLNNIAITGTDIIWYNNSTGNSVLPNSTLLQNGVTYYASQTINGCESPTRLAISIQLINTLNANNYSETLCDDLNNGFETINLSNYNSFLISSTGNLFKYYYSLNGAQNQLVSDEVQNSSNYNLSIGNNLFYVRIESPNTCFQIVTLELQLVSKPFLNINDIMPICEGETITINAGNGYDTYLWSTNEVSSSITVSQPGNYSVTVSKNHGTTTCSSTKNFTVVNSNIGTISEIITSDWTQNENTISVLLGSNSFGNYEYSLNGIDFQDNNTFHGLENGEYTVYVRDKNGCGISSEDIYLLMYPKFFTPNGDGYNDFWKIKFSENEPNLKVKIFDRYGKFLFEFYPNSIGWDGKFNNIDSPSTDYWFVVIRQNGKEYKGHFSLIR